jgi:hypothetical protein
MATKRKTTGPVLYVSPMEVVRQKGSMDGSVWETMTFFFAVASLARTPLFLVVAG